MRQRLATASAAVLLVLAPACARPGDEMTDEQKRARIAEMYDSYRSAFPTVPTADIATVDALREAGDLVLVDVRSAEEQAVSRLPGALTREEFEARREELQGHRVVTYCTIGYRSGLYAAELRADGWDAANLAGSILAWTHAGRPLVDPEGDPTRRVHVYGRTWDLAAEGYQTVW